MGDTKPFPSSSVCLAEMKHSFTAQSNPPSQLQPPHITSQERLLHCRCFRLCTPRSAGQPQLTPLKAHFLRACLWVPDFAFVHQPLWVVHPPCFLGTTKSFLRRQWSSHGAHMWLFEDHRLFVGRRGCKIFHLPSSTSSLGCFLLKKFVLLFLVPSGCIPQCANLFASWLFPRVGAPQTPLEPGKDSEPPLHFAVCPSGSVQ